MPPTPRSPVRRGDVETIPRREFGRTGHRSTRVIFGSWAICRATEAQADRAFALLEKYGVNHVDTAPMYGNAEKLIGRWLAKRRDEVFVATKTRSRTREGARESLRRSLERLRVDSIDLWQMHGLTGQAGWERALSPGGAIDAFVEAREKGLVRHLGVTGHGIRAPEMHLQSLAKFDFDSVMLPYNHAMMQLPRYAAPFRKLEGICRRRRTALQCMKAAAHRPCPSPSKTFNTWFYEPLAVQRAVDAAVHWALGNPAAFLPSVGDLGVLPKFLDAASRFEARPSEAEMLALSEELGIRPIFR